VLYTKPHLNYERQLALLASRGLIIDDRAKAISTLRTVGYYRLSGYLYGFRRITPELGRERRSDEFEPGTRLSWAVELCAFDDRLRVCFLAGLQRLEVILRTRTAYQLGKRDAFVHLDPVVLNRDLTLQLGGDDRYVAWRLRYDKLQADARRERYVVHFNEKYDGSVPIWVAVEFMDLGCLTSLVGLAHTADRRQLSREFRAGYASVLDKWLRLLNIARNTCAHNGRVWNRRWTFAPPKPPALGDTAPVHHLSQMTDLSRTYVPLAICAHLLRSADPTDVWHTAITDLMVGIPAIPTLDVEGTMGFPQGWRSLELWS